MDFITVFMNKLSYPKKMGLISTLFILPTLISAFFLVDNLGAKVEKAENEHDGLMYISTIRQMYQHLPQHRGMTNAYRNGSVEFRDKILEKRKQIEEDIAAIDTIDAQLGASFETTELWAATKQEWATLRDKSFRAAPKQVFEEHTALISKLYSLIEKVARNSGLSLDSAKNTHYIMEVLILDLPFITEYLGQARGLSSGIAASGRLTVEQKLKLNNLIGAIKDKSKHVVSSMRIALNENPGLIDKVNDKMAERDNATFDFIKLIEREIISPDTISADAGNMFDLGTQAIKANYALFDELVNDLDDLFYERVDESQSYRNTILFVIFVSLSIAMMLFYVFYKSTLSTFSTLGNASKGIASGDLTVELQSEAEDESLIIVDSMNQMVSDLNGTMTKLSTDASTLASSSEELSVTTEQLKNNISQQQVQTEQIVSSMDTMTSKVKDIAENADMLAAEAQTASQETTTGSTIINQTITSINTIASGIGHAAKAVYQLEDSSNEIGSILNVIQGVAEQTNLLALNAAIEAARAGEHGRGFAVVADEVRTLATRTQESAEHIREMVNALQENTRDASSVMNSEKEKAEGILTTTQEATDSLDRIVNSMSKISNMSSQVAQIAEEQNAVSLEVNDNVTTVSQFSSSNQQSIQQVSDASQELAKLATGLNDITHNFKVK